ncbi:hypothetical protein [Allonocardiopsis opalescens]|uniref:Polysaccharide lyase-like protein n=1 Tax=Allonocardiopsis opalescens TaxID=1144618 RepID=A0A2T0PZU5_9ACTN|nr:hypothetical protein [Allonocardiopsis opalescens]PRX97058.1 hypothetical protein CLV72_10694 [Allonocardiopsis opalescens]
MGAHRWRTAAAASAALLAATALAGQAGADTRGAPAAAAPAAQDRPAPDGWELVHAEGFERLRPVGDTGWRPDRDGPGSPYDVDGYDNDGEYFRTIGGADFDRQLATTDLYRRSFAFGEDGWLTAELAARDTDGDGLADESPSLTRDRLPGAGPVAHLESPHHGAVVVRATEELPAEYRVEVTLRTIDFGGQRGGSWDYDGLVNGYRPTGCSTNFPWAASGDFSRPECEWFDVTRDANGFYYLGIMDYARPAPHNNVFIHTHRKVVMDGYNRYRYTGSGLRYCDTATGQYRPYEWGSGNGVNMLFMTDDRRYGNQPGTEYVMESECGTAVGGGIVSQADLMPELMPEQSYRFAIERRAGSYVLEVTGTFRHVGERTLRYERAFDEDGLPIYHYNQNAEEYDGAHDATWTYPSPNGTYTHEGVWPAGSAYPDNFLIGQPHMNFYEGDARIDDIRLYVPAGS